MNTFVVADWYLGEHRFHLLRRPFERQDEMVSQLIKNHNEKVHTSDLVYVVGDVCYREAPEYLHFVKQFNGRKILIRGNHDCCFSDDELLEYFFKIIPEGDGIEIDGGKEKYYANH